MASIECLQEVVRALVARRQALRERDADGEELESNRLELARRQRELTHALIERHLRPALSIPSRRSIDLVELTDDAENRCKSR